jgi:hypothetical protein
LPGVRNNLLENEKSDMWFTMQSEGYFTTPTPVKFLTDFTIRYKTLDDARTGSAVPEAVPEFSLRIWVSGPGVYPDKHQIPNTSDIQMVKNWWHQLLGHFGSYEQYPPCE